MVRNYGWWLAVVFFHFDTTTFQFQSKKVFFSLCPISATQNWNVPRKLPTYIRIIIILEHNCPQAYTKMYVGIVRIGVRVSGLSILTTKYTLLTSIPRHMYNSLTLKVFCTAFDANTSLYDSDTYSTVQKQLLHSLHLPRKRARRARSARLVVFS